MNQAEPTPVSDVSIQQMGFMRRMRQLWPGLNIPDDQAIRIMNLMNEHGTRSLPPIGSAFLDDYIAW